MNATSKFHRERHRRYLSLLGWRSQLQSLADAVSASAPGAKAYIFGSALKGELVANSDIDVLVVVRGTLGSNTDRARLALRIEDGLADPSIFEIHLTDGSGFAWYRRHAKGLTPLEELSSSR